MRLEWHSYLIPGVMLMALGTIGVTQWGIRPLTLGAIAAGFFLLLAAVLEARGRGGGVMRSSISPWSAPAVAAVGGQVSS